MDLQALEVFLDVTRHRNFAQVARLRQMAPSSVSRAISGLEEELGVRLFQRTTRQMTLTSAGEALHARLDGLLEDVRDALASAQEDARSIRGRLTLTAPVTFAELHLVPLLPELARRFPELSFEMLWSNEIIELQDARVDIAIRLGRLRASSYAVRKLADMTYVLCASPSYLDRYGRPLAPSGLARHECLRYPVPGHQAIWRFRVSGEMYEHDVTGRFTISSGVGLTQAAIQGLGVALLPHWNVAPWLETGALEQLLPEWEATASSFDLGVWALHPDRHHVPARTRAVLDFLVERFDANTL